MTTEPLGLKPYVAISDGICYPLAGVPLPPGGHTLEQRFNLSQALASDELGRRNDEPTRFPDGHVISPFRTKTWKVVTPEDAANIPKPTQEEEAWERLRLGDRQRLEQYREETSIWYEALGRYVASFETMVSDLVMLARRLLRKSGLESTQALDIIVANQTAEPLARFTETLYIATIDDLSAAERKVSDMIFTRVKKCTEARNDVVHSSWYPGGTAPLSATSFLEAEGVKFIHQTKDGVAFRSFSYDVYSLNWLRAQCQSTSLLLSDLIYRIKHKDFPLDFFIKFDTNGVERAVCYTHILGRWIWQKYPQASRTPPPKLGPEPHPSKRFTTAVPTDVQSLRLEQVEFMEYFNRHKDGR